MGVKVRERGVHSRPVPSPEHTPYPNEDCSGRDERGDGKSIPMRKGLD